MAGDIIEKTIYEKSRLEEKERIIYAKQVEFAEEEVKAILELEGITEERLLEENK
ncbi:MAG: hypothetical protein Q9M94_02135 [Candidatus Gracilibacteria bacterium]|nr:hypothetical protein [Candidatus Gracilibacteria bacterium]MDQ7023331.1 hypothetical protein [Candidatus Gracilibacteria bacterium]